MHLAQGAKGLVTAGSRSSPQVNIVATVGASIGVPVIVHTPQGELSPEVVAAQNKGAKVIQHKAGYNNVIIARARQCAKDNGYTDIPFGMECQEAVTQTRQQVKNIPNDVARIVMPVGSGMSLAGVLHGLQDWGLFIPVVGIVVGASPTKRLDRFAPLFWQKMVTLVPSGLDYKTSAPNSDWNGIRLDPIYEAKCTPFLKPQDLFWIVGIRETEITK